MAQLHQICLDLERTFPGNRLFQAGGALYTELRSVLFAVACERARLGYVQGMSHLAALLLLFMPAADAFICMIGILDGAPHLESFFLVDMQAISRYSQALNVVLAINVPAVACRCHPLPRCPAPSTVPWATNIDCSRRRRRAGVMVRLGRLREVGVDSRLFVLKW
jgi:hypothetical protein